MTPATKPYAHITVEPVAGALGAEIGGVDLTRPLADDVLAEVRRAFVENLVICFRDQDITPEQHKAFASQLEEVLGVDRYVLYRHLKLLNAAGLIDAKEIGRMKEYSINKRQRELVMNILSQGEQEARKTRSMDSGSIQSTRSMLINTLYTGGQEVGQDEKESSSEVISHTVNLREDDRRGLL